VPDKTLQFSFRFPVLVSLRARSRPPFSTAARQSPLPGESVFLHVLIVGVQRRFE
jgi:hypothetical protein